MAHNHFEDLKIISFFLNSPSIIQKIKNRANNTFVAAIDIGIEIPNKTKTIFFKSFIKLINIFN